MKKIKCIDAVSAITFGLEEQEAFYTANAMRCLWGWKRGGVKNLKAARTYIDKLIREIETEAA
jgi:hypothetical protein